MEYEINKGIEKNVEFKGLKANYLFIFAGGLLVIIVLVVILYMININQTVCLILGGGFGVILVWQVFRMNRRYGEHGLMKFWASKQHPRFLLNRKSIRLILTCKTPKV